MFNFSETNDKELENIIKTYEDKVLLMKLITDKDTEEYEFALKERSRRGNGEAK